MSPLIDKVQARRAALLAEHDELSKQRSALLDGASAARRGLKASEQRSYDACGKRRDELEDELRECAARLDELRSNDAREAAAAPTRIPTSQNGQRMTETRSGWAVGSEPATYQPGRPDAPSFFRDMASARSGDGEAIDRLRRNNSEARALGNTSGTGGSGGEFAPPGYLLDQYVALARAGRVTADRFQRAELPQGVSSIQVPKVTGGTSALVQTSQNSAVSQTDLTTAYLSSQIMTVAGKEVFSVQLLDQSGIDIDRIIMADLAADAARTLDRQVLTGTGVGPTILGITNVSGLNAITYTQATPSVTGAGGFYSQVNKAVAAVSSNRFLPPDAIVMHPRRWSWVAAAYDSTGRPLVSPTGGQFNGVADAGSVVAQGMAGTMAGLPVYLDPNISTTNGASSTEDYVIVARFADCMLWESPPVAMMFDAPYSDSMGILARIHFYAAALPQRYPASVAVISGTGLVSPAY